MRKKKNINNTNFSTTTNLLHTQLLLDIFEKEYFYILLYHITRHFFPHDFLPFFSDDDSEQAKASKNLPMFF